MTGLQKQKARSHLKRFRSRKGPHVFLSSSLSSVSPRCSQLMTVGLTTKKKEKIPLLPGKATGKGLPNKSLSTSGPFSPSPGDSLSSFTRQRGHRQTYCKHFAWAAKWTAMASQQLRLQCPPPPLPVSSTVWTAAVVAVEEFVVVTLEQRLC